jgi:lipid A 3-O-deacylase
MRQLVLALVVFACTSSAIPAQRSVLFYWENDSFGSPLGRATDTDYTNGLRVVIGTAVEPRWGPMIRKLCERVDDGCAKLASTSAYGFTHQFYTPQRITFARPQPRDRPWAGTMYLSAHMTLSDENHQHSLEGELGILGQGAGAQYVQSKWHQLISSPNDPAGWHHQLKNEPIVNVVYGYSRRFHSERVPYADAIVNPGFSLGTLTTYPSLGGTVRAGWHPSGFPTPILPHGIFGEEPVTQRRSAFRTELYLMAGADVRYVLHNSTLDGGFLRDGPSVQRTPLVRDLRLGFSGRLDSFRVTYNYVMRGEEFTPPPLRDGKHNYHSLAIAWEPR